METPKPDPIILNKPIESAPAVPRTFPTTPVEPIRSGNMSTMDKFKDYAKKHKKLVIGLGVLLFALLIVLIVILLTSKPLSKIVVDNTPVVSAPVSQKVVPVVLTTKCTSENENISAMIPSDWSCGKKSELVKDLSLNGPDMSISFPVDVQGSLGCGLDTTNCVSKVIYNSAKVVSLSTHSDSKGIFVLTGNIKLNDKNYLVNVTLINKSQAELTAEQKALIIQILESIEAAPVGTATTKTLKFTVDPVFGTMSGTKSLVGSVVVDSSVSLVQKSASALSIESKGNTALVILNVHEWFTEFFQKAEFVGSTPSLGNAYRVTMGGEGGTQIFYLPAAQLKLGSDKCTGISSPVGYYNAPCGDVPTDGGYVFQCASTSGVNDLDFCDSVMQNLTFTLRNN